MGNLTYYELLEMSPKYRTFRKLHEMYRKFDADKDVLTLEIGDTVYRGYFVSFSFTQTADNPWNWKYAINFVSLADLTANEVRGDDTYAENDYIIEE